MVSWELAAEARRLVFMARNRSLPDAFAEMEKALASNHRTDRADGRPICTECLGTGYEDAAIAAETHQGDSTK